ncbi:hypothetical protein QGN29_06145 [Temperatibacter marinus]|uniref:Uncharacterized protein n=1 Tax=Temperatibacter marinus TaxID=1456591 RepID=A0AA52HBS7_9PROT|nr:hypothetical protein [Temperatibacter marinus]WND03953.1 hypothetical protein QGN29_06145 [Temperatibacter marinus]
MSTITKVISGAIFLGLIIGAVVLMTTDIPAPESKVSKTLSNDRFPG